MSLATTYRWLIPLLSLLWLPQGRAAINGSCEGFNFPVAADGIEIRSTIQVRVLRQDAPLYDTDSTVTGARNLAFDQMLQPLSLPPPPGSGSRIKVGLADRPSVTGWVERRDLLCSPHPLKANRLERQAFVNTQPYASTSAQPAAVQAYGDPQRNGCATNGCPRQSRFEHLFIYAADTDSNAVLVARTYNLEPSDHLVGWLDGAKEIIEWNTRFGLQPSEHPRSGCDAGTRGSNTVWLYSRPEQAAQKSTTQAYPVLGNCDGRWYSYPLRLAIIGEESSGGHKLYKVAAPTLGVNLSAPSSEQNDQMYGRDIILDRLQQLKGVDLMFAIDGTRSMTPYIARTVDIAKTVATELTGAGTDRGSNFRFGYTVYRDTYASNETGCDAIGVCVGLPLSSSCQPASQSAELTRFTRAMQSVREIPPSGRQSEDDYPEQLYGGIRQALVNLKPCPERTKVLVIIGDNGDGANALPAALSGELATWKTKPVVIVVQTPHTSNVAHQDDYDAAYQAFRDQTESLIKSLTPAEYRGHATNRQDLFTTTDTSTIVRSVTDRIGRYTSGTGIQAAIDAVAGGEALRTFIQDRITADSNELPVLFWERIDQRVCNEGGADCNTPISHRVTEGYVAADDPDWSKQVWMRYEALGSRKGWMALLSRLADSTDDDGLNPERLHSRFKNGLVKTVEELIGGEPPFQDRLETLHEFMSRTEDLPLRADPMLLQYTASDVDTIEPCEIQHIRAYLHVRLNVLEAVSRNPRDRPSYGQSSVIVPCALSAKGQKIPVLNFDPTASTALGGTPNHSYLHRDALGSGYWLPEEFLP